MIAAATACGIHSCFHLLRKNQQSFSFAGTYEAKGVWNLVDYHFAENEQGYTVWTADCEFRFSGLMQVMSWFMPASMFRKQS